MSHYSMSFDGSIAVKLLGKQGFELPPKPGDPVVLPTDVSELDSSDLMTSFALFTAWTDYASAQVGLAVVAEREAERQLEHAEAKAWRDIPPKTPVTAAKAIVSLDRSVIESKQELDTAYAYRRLVSDLASRYERDAAVLSRELTRRTSESSPKMSRRDRWSS